MTEQRGSVAFHLYCESGLDRLVVSHTFRIHTFCDAYNLIRQLNLLLFYDLEVADDVHSCFRCKESELVELVIFEELVCNLDDALLSAVLAVEVDTYSNLVLDALEIEDAESLIYVLRRNVVQNGTVFQCADY